MTVVHSVMSKQARLARALSQEGLAPKAVTRRDLTSEEKRLCRHRAHEGKTVSEMAQAINWTLSTNSLYSKLKAINIKPHNTYNRYLRTKGC